MTKRDKLALIISYAILVSILLINLFTSVDLAREVSELKSESVTQQQEELTKIDDLATMISNLTVPPDGTACPDIVIQSQPFWYTVDGIAEFISTTGPMWREWPETIEALRYIMTSDE